MKLTAPAQARGRGSLSVCSTDHRTSDPGACMAEFRATPDDLSEVIRRQQKAEVKGQVPYLAAALGAAGLFWPLYPPLALVALGMSVAWSLSTYWMVRSISAAYLWRYAWLQEGVTVEVAEEGLHLGSPRGSSLIRWSGGIAVRSLPGCFVLEDEGEDVVVLPKRYLNSTELVLLQNRVVA
jgi:hypothetical protein